MQKDLGMGACLDKFDPFLLARLEHFAVHGRADLKGILRAEVVVELDHGQIRACDGQILVKNLQVMVQQTVQPVLHEVSLERKVHHEFFIPKEYRADLKK